jgi:nucleoside 2-deoxyribosyltransferase
MKIYLSGPIMGCTDAEAKDWRAIAKGLCPTAIDPMARDYRGIEGDHAAEIVQNDKADIRNCDGVLVYWHLLNRPNVGTSMEILYAWSQGKPIAVVNATGEPLSPWITYHCSGRVFRTIEEALRALLLLS